MTIAEQIQIVEDNLNEYGVCDITFEEYNYLKDELYSSGCLAGMELGKAELLDKVAEIFPKSFCTYCNQEVCEGGMVGTIQECETIRMIKDVLDEVIAEMKAEVEE